MRWHALPMQKKRARPEMAQSEILTAFLRVRLNSTSTLPAMLSAIEKRPVMPAMKRQKKKIAPTLWERTGPRNLRIFGKMMKPSSNVESEEASDSNGMP